MFPWAQAGRKRGTCAGSEVPVYLRSQIFDLKSKTLDSSHSPPVTVIGYYTAKPSFHVRTWSPEIAPADLEMHVWEPDLREWEPPDLRCTETLATIHCSLLTGHAGAHHSKTTGVYWH